MINIAESQLKQVKAQLQEVQLFYKYAMKKCGDTQSELDNCQRENDQYKQIFHKNKQYGKMLREKIVGLKKRIIKMRAAEFELKMKYTDLDREHQGLEKQNQQLQRKYTDLSHTHEDLKTQNQQLQTQVSTIFNAALETTPTNPLVNDGNVQSSVSADENPAPSPPRTPPRLKSKNTSSLQRKETPVRKTQKKKRRNSTYTGRQTRSQTKRSRA